LILDLIRLFPYVLYSIGKVHNHRSLAYSLCNGDRR